MVFDAILYTAAIVSVLAIIGSHKAPATRPARQVEATIATLHAIGEALPDEVFAIDVPDYDELFAEADTIAPPAVAPAVFDCGNISTIVESELVDAAEVAIACYWEEQQPVAEVDDFSDLLAISAPRTIDTRWLATYGTHALRTLGVVEGITGARRWAKAQAVEVLQAHYAAA